ncbi:hypothetical protein Tco_0481803 [Tanacetum coccineum]
MYQHIPRRVNEPCNNIKDDDSVSMMFATIELVDPIPLRIPDELVTKEMKQTEAYKDYDVDYKIVFVPMIQLQPIVSTQGTPKTLSAPRSPKLTKYVQKRKGNVLGIKITTKRQEDPIILIPTYKEIEKEYLTEAQDVSIAMNESAKEAKAIENFDMVEK